MAFSMSPLASIRAARQSLNPALVRSRNSFTSWAGICTAGCCVLVLLSYLDFVNLVLQNPLLGQFSQFFTERPAPEPSGAGHWNFPPRFFSVVLRPEARWSRRLLPAVPRLPRSRLPASRTVRTRWYPHTRHLR